MAGSLAYQRACSAALHLDRKEEMAYLDHLEASCPSDLEVRRMEEVAYLNVLAFEPLRQ